MYIINKNFLDVIANLKKIYVNYKIIIKISCPQ